jgi:hypothetical protein
VNYEQLPINQAVNAKVANYQRDGAQRIHNQVSCLLHLLLPYNKALLLSCVACCILLASVSSRSSIIHILLLSYATICATATAAAALALPLLTTAYAATVVYTNTHTQNREEHPTTSLTHSVAHSLTHSRAGMWSLRNRT